jgi:predicted flap endonuclease-1-like 5' DNA nuclease
MQAELETAQDLMVRRDQEIATLKTWVDQLEVKEAEITRLRGRITELEPVRDRLAATETTLLDLEQQARKARDERDALEGRLQAQVTESQAEREYQEHQAQAQASQHLAALRVQEELVRKLREDVAEMDVFRQDLAIKQAQLAEAEERRVMDVSEREEEIAALRRRLVEYRVAQGLIGKQALRQPDGDAKEKAGDKPIAGPASPKDDLKKIYGIGPVIERVLNRMGTHTFLQIAQWDQTDIERVADRLSTFPDRIVRDNWVESAKQQHYLKYGEKL